MTQRSRRRPRRGGLRTAGPPGPRGSTSSGETPGRGQAAGEGKGTGTPLPPASPPAAPPLSPAQRQRARPGSSPHRRYSAYSSRAAASTCSRSMPGAGGLLERRARRGEGERRAGRLRARGRWSAPSGTYRRRRRRRRSAPLRTRSVPACRGGAKPAGRARAGAHTAAAGRGRSPLAPCCRSRGGRAGGARRYRQARCRRRGTGTDTHPQHRTPSKARPPPDPPPPPPRLGARPCPELPPPFGPYLGPPRFGRVGEGWSWSVARSRAPLPL